MKVRITAISLMFILVAGAVLGSDAKIEQALRDADEAWSKAAGAKDLDKTVSFYAADAVVLPPNEPMVTTNQGIRNLWKGFLDSLSNISWTTTRVEVSKSGDMACLIGTYELTMKDGTKDHGKYCEVWQKQGNVEGNERYVQLGSACGTCNKFTGCWICGEEVNRYSLASHHQTLVPT